MEKDKVRLSKKRLKVLRRRRWSAQLEALRQLRIKMGNTYLLLRAQEGQDGQVWTQFLDRLTQEFQELRERQEPMSPQSWLALMLQSKKLSASAMQDIEDILHQAQVEEDFDVKSSA